MLQAIPYMYLVLHCTFRERFLQKVFLWPKWIYVIKSLTDGAIYRLDPTYRRITARMQFKMCQKVAISQTMVPT